MKHTIKTAFATALLASAISAPAMADPGEQCIDRWLVQGKLEPVAKVKADITQYKLSTEHFAVIVQKDVLNSPRRHVMVFNTVQQFTAYNHINPADKGKLLYQTIEKQLHSRTLGAAPNLIQPCHSQIAEYFINGQKVAHSAK